MKWLKIILYPLLITAGVPLVGQHIPEVFCDFSMPDTVCKDEDVIITNLSQGASSYYWKFCTGDPLTDMRGEDLGNPSGFLQTPLAAALVQDNGNYYAFLTSAGNGSIIKLTFGNSLFNTPSVENLGSYNLLTSDVFGIQVKKDQGIWYGFVTNGNQLIRLDMGPTLSIDVPTARVVATSPFMNKARGLTIEWDGTVWTGFCVNFPGQTITRFTWVNGLNKDPVVDDLGNLGGLTEPVHPALIREGVNWHLFITNTTSLVQLDFGTSLQNNPTATNLGAMGWLTDDRGISLFTSCNHPYGFITNHNMVENLILQINFFGGINGQKSITPLGSVANLYLPLALSESHEISDTIFTLAVNETSLTLLWFPPCSNPPLPASAQFDPSPVRFTAPGKYTVKLTVDKGMNSEQTVCKEIYIDATPPVDLGNDTTLCEGSQLQLDAGSGFDHYLWNTGETSRSIIADTAGTYAIYASKNNGCNSQDSIRIAIAFADSSQTDTAICYGKRYFAGGYFRTTSGTYYDTLRTKSMCDSIVKTNLTVWPPVEVVIEKDTCLFSGQTFDLTAIANGPAEWEWQDGSVLPTLRVVKPGKYWVTASVNGCQNSDTAMITPCPAIVVFPNAFTPNGDGLNDSFKPGGTEISGFHMIIFDRWGRQVFETTDPGTGWTGVDHNQTAEAGVYTFIATYRETPEDETLRQVRGSFTLVR